MTATVTDRTVLVTGGAGFVGSHIADAHIPGNEVRILDNFSSGMRANVPERATSATARPTSRRPANTSASSQRFHSRTASTTT